MTLLKNDNINRSDFDITISFGSTKHRYRDVCCNIELSIATFDLTNSQSNHKSREKVYLVLNFRNNNF